MRTLCKNFLKGLLFGTVCVCLLALYWLLLLRPQLTRQQTQALKTAYTLPAPQAENLGSGSLLGQGKESSAIDLASLQAAYPDVKAWLTVPGTQIDYPVLQSGADDPEHYLRRGFTGSWRFAGSLFLQADCVPDGRCLVIYGHNMTDGSMFGGLPNYLDAAYARQHATVRLETPAGVDEYTVAAVLETDAAQLPFNRTVFADDADFLAFVDSLLAASKIQTGVSITADSRLLVLVTCSYSWPNARYVVAAVC